MGKAVTIRGLIRPAQVAVGVILLPGIWLLLKYVCGISDRYLPPPLDVLGALTDLEPSFFHHLAATAVRCIFGLVAGIGFGIGLGIAVNTSASLRALLLPGIQAMR